MALIVALRALKLGDFLTGVPALRALRRHFAADRVVLAAPAWLAPLVELAGAVNAVVDTGSLTPLAPTLHGADVAVNLHGRGPQSTALLRASRPRRLISYGVDGRRWRDDEHETVRWCRLLAESGVPADPSDLRIHPPPAPPPPWSVGATLVHPGASAGARRWPVERWAAVAEAEAAAGRRVAVTGNGRETELAAAVARRAGLPEEAVVAGTTDLLALAAAVAAADRVVCGDTGVAHLATALGTPSVVLFGPVPPSLWGPPPDGPHVALWAGSTGEPNAADVDAGLLAIGVDEVVGALSRCG